MPADRPVRRRDLLLLRVGSGAGTCVELSGRTLYMQFIDLERTQAAAAAIGAEHYEEPWLGEPPPVCTPQSLRDLFDDLAHSLEGVEILRLTDRAWLVPEPLRQEVERLLARFEARGGRVEDVA